jgi:hypothetical protein
MKIFCRIFFILFVTSARAEFHFSNIASSGEEPLWTLSDSKGEKIFQLEDGLSDPKIEEEKTFKIGEKKIWFIRYSTAPLGTLILTQVDYGIFILDADKNTKVYDVIANEPLKLSRFKGGKAFYQRKRDWKFLTDKKVLKLGELDEFSAKSISIQL